jgi:hypothetical protein
MGIKNLIGYCLAIAGIGVGLLSLLFLLHSQFYSQVFLYGLGLFAFLSLFAGVFILNKN